MWLDLYPSCFCASWFDGFWILSQMAHKTHYYRFNHLIIPFMLIWFVCFFVSFAEGLGWVYALPFIVAVIFGVMLRFHLVKYYQLTQTNCFLELLAGLFCFPCSTAQMARHVYGYRKIFDGDADPDRLVSICRDYLPNLLLETFILIWLFNIIIERTITRYKIGCLLILIFRLVAYEFLSLLNWWFCNVHWTALNTIGARGKLCSIRCILIKLYNNHNLLVKPCLFASWTRHFYVVIQ